MKYWDEGRVRKYLEERKTEVSALEYTLYLLDLERTKNKIKLTHHDYVIEDDDGEI